MSQMYLNEDTDVTSEQLACTTTTRRITGFLSALRPAKGLNTPQTC